MPYLTVGQERIFYAQHGDAGPVLLYVHGAGGSHQHWLHQLQHVQAVRSYALDLPGHSRSEGMGRQTIADYSQFVLAFLDALNLEKASLVGHSMGGAITLQTALNNPQRVEGIILVGTGARLRVLPAFLQGLQDDFMATVHQICSYCYAEGAAEELVRQGEADFLANDPEVLHGDFAACDAFDVIGRLEEITCPALVICGSEDQMTPLKYSTYLRDHIPAARLVTVEGAGHMAMMEQPEAVSQAIAAFVAGQARSG